MESKRNSWKKNFSWRMSSGEIHTLGYQPSVFSWAKNEMLPTNRNGKSGGFKRWTHWMAAIFEFSKSRDALVWRVLSWFCFFGSGGTRKELVQSSGHDLSVQLYRLVSKRANNKNTTSTTTVNFVIKNKTTIT